LKIFFVGQCCHIHGVSAAESALVAGVLSPLISHSLVYLAGAAAGLMVLGWGFWRWELQVSGRTLDPSPGDIGNAA